MRDPLGLNERLFAVWYPWVCGLSEKAGQREIRGELLSEAKGRTLEFGAGSGLNLPHYPAAVTELVITEPSPHMLKRLRPLLATRRPPVGSVELVQAGAEDLPFDDASFDTVVGTYVHCTIDDPPRALAEIARVLKPGGRYLFLEHVHAGEGTMQGAFQDLIELPHRYVCAGCHPNRRFAELLAASPLDVERAARGKMPRAFPSVSSTLIGSARASSAP